MIRAILFDLDNTLLGNSMESFVPAYLAALSNFMSDLFPSETFVRNLLRATNAMTADTDASRTNMEVFDAAFFPALGGDRETLEPRFEAFYATRFPILRGLTQVRPTARPLMEWVFEQAFQVAIATNPLFPRTAIDQRLDWAGVPVHEFSYHLVTSYEIMHATKPHAAYYLEIAERLGRAPKECLVVGDDWEMDIYPALDLGMWAYWIASPDEPAPDGGDSLIGQGTLATFSRWIQSS